jgi:hypothetical protein
MATEKGSPMGTVDAHLAAIADHVRYQQGYGDTYKPTTGRLVQAVRAALKPMARRTSGPKKELSWKQLDLLCMKLREKQNQPHRAASMRWLWGRDRFMFLLAMNGLLRASEVVRMAPTDLMVNTLDDGRACLAIYVNPLCKNDTERKGHTRYAVERPGENTCVVAAWREYERSLQEQAFSPPREGKYRCFRNSLGNGSRRIHRGADYSTGSRRWALRTGRQKDHARMDFTPCALGEQQQQHNKERRWNRSEHTATGGAMRCWRTSDKT